MSNLIRRMQRISDRGRKAKKAARNRQFATRMDPKKPQPREPLKRGTGGINGCFRPSNEASLADLREYHQENMGLRRAHQLQRVPSSTWRPPSKSNDPAYRKSIWPAAKVARRKSEENRT